MKLQIITPAKKVPEYKVSVHKTGKITFSESAAIHFNITPNIGIALAVNAEDDTDINVYGIYVSANDETGYKIVKSGKYYSIIAASFFESREISYLNGDLSYFVTDILIDGEKVLKFMPNKRQMAKK